MKEFDATVRYHVIEGYGPAAVYLPALSFPSLANFLPTATHSKMRGFRSILIDYLGVGHSERPSDFDHSMQNHAKIVAKILDHEGLQKCVIVGHSMGGTVAIYLAMQRPDLVSELIVCEGNVTPGGGMGTQYFTSVSETEFVTTLFPKLLAKWRKDGRDGDTEAQWRCGAWEDVDFTGIYRNSKSLVDLPANFKQSFLSLPLKRTFVYGEETYPENTGEIKADAPDPSELKRNGISIAVVPGVGHDQMIFNPNAFVEVLSRALDRPAH
ncbi:alpha/beta fold hydrolase [Parasedimentitalea maritima]|uniref:alpha/beta fold hydrolase n=1 Tax=Parasedimentitalea maritima TaxID=2578117 RepID=UPI0014857772|nr:alpha/beta hydrolase [Zongyanglinia marina]